MEPKDVERWREVTANLSSLYLEQATTQESLLREKIRLGQDLAGEHSSQASLDRAIREQTLDLETTLLQIGAQIAAQREEKDYLRAVTFG